MAEDGLEIDTGSPDRLQGVEQEDFALRDQRKLEAWDRAGTSGKGQVDRRSRHKQANVAAPKEAAVFNRGHVVMTLPQSGNKTTYR